jgi:PilZ domain
VAFDARHPALGMGQPAGLMYYSFSMHEDTRGLRFPFRAGAEVVLEGSSESIPARVTELSLQGCFLEMSASLEEKQRVQVKIVYSGESFEALANILYVRPTGVGVVFGDVKADSRDMLQKWVLAELDRQGQSKHP